MNFDSKNKWWKQKLFMQDQNINILYPNEKNMIIVPNHKKNGDYYKNPCLSNLMNDFLFKEKWWKEAFLAKPK